MSDEKKSETLIMTSLSRSKAGFNVLIKTHPTVEEFMKNLGIGAEEVSPFNYGRHWSLPKGALRELTAYWLPEELNGILPTDSTRLFYRLDRLGQPLMLEGEARGIPIVNLSFLRLVGIGDGSGVTFNVSGVSSRDGIRELAAQLKQAQRAFNLAYMKPITINITMSSTEL